MLVKDRSIMHQQVVNLFANAVTAVVAFGCNECFAGGRGGRTEFLLARGREGNFLGGRYSAKLGGSGASVWIHLNGRRAGGNSDGYDSSKARHEVSGQVQQVERKHIRQTLALCRFDQTTQLVLAGHSKIGVEQRVHAEIRRESNMHSHKARVVFNFIVQVSELVKQRCLLRLGSLVASASSCLIVVITGSVALGGLLDSLYAAEKMCVFEAHKGNRRLATVLHRLRRLILLENNKQSKPAKRVGLTHHAHSMVEAALRRSFVVQNFPV
mmetsp:Transcript_41840/g.72646  ORF Transcript_41840/g.72646 Transcript_41840/m.72646 type:complete len:269 (+) Transcript_41840:1944-2750(+)